MKDTRELSMIALIPHGNVQSQLLALQQEYRKAGVQTFLPLVCPLEFFDGELDEKTAVKKTACWAERFNQHQKALAIGKPRLEDGQIYSFFDKSSNLIDDAEYLIPAQPPTVPLRLKSAAFLYGAAQKQDAELENFGKIEDTIFSTIFPVQMRVFQILAVFLSVQSTEKQFFCHWSMGKTTWIKAKL